MAASCATPETVLLGATPVEFPSERLQLLKDSSSMLRAGDMEGLREALRQDGLLFLRGALKRDAVLAARSAVLQRMADMGGVLEESFGAEAAVLKAKCGVGCVPFMEGNKQLPEVMAVAEGKEIRSLFDGLFGEKALTLDYKWLRAVPRRRFTGAHMDSVYMSRGSSRLLTCWIPLGDTPLRMGALALMPGSHTSEGFARVRDTYGSLDFEAARVKGSGWLTEDPEDAERLGSGGGVWHAANYSAGDVVVFGMHTLHMSTSNSTDLARLSMDVRWQPASDAPDPRYVGEAANPTGRVRAGVFGAEDEKGGDTGTAKPATGVHVGGGPADAPEHPGKEAPSEWRTMADLRKEWGL